MWSKLDKDYGHDHIHSGRDEADSKADDAAARDDTTNPETLPHAFGVHSFTAFPNL